MVSKILKVALLQMESSPDQEHNLAKGEEVCRGAAQMGADIALFPEMWNIGYRGYKDPYFGNVDAWKDQSITRDSEFVQRFQRLAEELDMAIVITYLEKWDPLPRNSLSLINRHGEVILAYSKMHTCAFDAPEDQLTPGTETKVVLLDTKGAGKVKVGTMICFDREFPETARLLMLQDAEIILVPNSCMLNDPALGLGDVRIQQLRARAFENMVGVAMTNYAAPFNDGHSCAFDVNSATLSMAGNEEGVYIAEFDIARIRNWQRDEVWGRRFRHPGCYGLLVK